MKPFDKFPFHPILFAIYPVLALLANNIHEVSVSVLWRPLVIVMLGVGICLLLLQLLLRDIGIVSLITSFIIIIFFSYGRLYEYLKTTSLAVIGIVRHRYLVVIFIALLVVGVWFIIKRIRDTKTATRILNLVSIVLVTFPLFQTGTYLLKAASDERTVEDWVPAASLPTLEAKADKPDVYYIILDTYTRSDAMINDLGFDNSDFIRQLEGLGFYVAGCSRSNYNNTVNSLVSSLNMSYLPELYAQAAREGLSENDIWVLLKPNVVRRNFENLGYEIVAFDTGYEWNSMDDADLYLSRGRYSFANQFINPFEQMLMDTTVLSIYNDFMQKAVWDKYGGNSHPLANYIGQEEFILDKLPKLAAISEPTFTFAHVNIPHPPYVFSLDGYLTDPNYWSGQYMNAADEEHFRSGYIQSVEYINSRMLTIIKEITQNSSIQPIIIIQGDHGYWKDVGGIHPILNAYYLPGIQNNELYPTISPVNTFRLIFNEYFGGQYEFLQDNSFDIYNITTPLPENLPDCQ
jgi:hypothetical protein